MPEVLITSDADHVHADVESALAGPGITFRRHRFGQEVLPSVEADGEPDLAVLDLQIGNMGGMATCMALRLEEGAGRIDHIPVIMLLDRDADVFLARRSQADAWFVKPVNPIQLRACAERLLAADHLGLADDEPHLDAGEALLDRLEAGGEYESGESEPGDTTAGAATTD